jgi:hypothetical protein
MALSDYLSKIKMKVLYMGYGITFPKFTRYLYKGQFKYEGVAIC